MREQRWLFVVRTPHAELLRCEVYAIRVPTETGWVGLLPRAERAVLVVEPGLVIARADGATTLVGTAGGILRIEAKEATLLSPIAVAGPDAGAVRRELEALRRAPSPEMDLRRRIESLERGLVAQARRGEAGPRPGQS